jgi:1,4-dihydroxy-2-naphthoate octaprenyltransferase
MASAGHPTVSQWVAGARPRTLPAAVAPVAVGSGVAAYEGAFNASRALLALVVALSLQVGVNYANDYSDGVKGTDQARVGPVRLVGQGLASARSVKIAAIAALAFGGLAGFILVALSGSWWLLVVGALAIAAAWLYTGGPRPYGYAGLGEAFVFVFFGLVAVMGTAYTQTSQLTWLAFAASLPPGLWSMAILMANNLRDIPTDREVGKRTLAVNLGDSRSRQLYSATVLLGFLVIVGLVLVTPWALLGLIALPLAILPISTVRGGAAGRQLIPVLSGTSQVLLAGGLLLGLGLALGGSF